ncbi:MAG: tetratricopeptide repeat protein [Gammaproteobacteria bacterium]
MFIPTTRHPVFCWLLAGLLSAAGLTEINRALDIRAYNKLIENPEKITLSTPDLPPEAMFSKALELNRKGEHQEALRFYNEIEPSGDLQFKTAVQYNMGTIYLQQAAALWNAQGVWEYNRVNTLLDLAEQSFRKVLKHDPENWPARFNLEFALRIRPPAKTQEEAHFTGHKSSVHAIMPGIPRGGP